ncbi:hypothetical protein SAMD00079811_73260 [Scytonema sp. HK-05]|uniref:DUF3102 domain-containing protein n=1 Tax=Scytonema sp. HK-05 TaxID=1137095 RepID=UPI0009364073|nr:DUF3102 domain-containing protein [Scytonema sp. HK-05]OKH52899.1 hypothetical protein NIES2130_31345 [Scytonema sp. HK-05]BAY49697.1 hypothetical protein SAMD00079811_73260 [Scytonema sp. HK-05]
MSFNQSLFSSTKQLSNQEEQSFDYSVLDPRTKLFLQLHTKEIKSLMRRTAEDFIKIGQKLLEVKEKLGHGHFEDWLKAEFNWGMWTARKFMQITRRFKSVNFTDLSIDASALYVLASPSTPEVVLQEAFKRAGQGEVITHAKVKEITNQHKELTKPITSSYNAIDITTERIMRTTSHPTEPLQTAPVIGTQSTNVVKKSKDKLLDKKVETPAQFQISNRFNDIVSNANRSDDLPKEPVDIKTQLPFGVGHLLHITDLNLKDDKWFGEVAEIQEATATDLKVVIRISLQPPTIEE